MAYSTVGSLAHWRNQAALAELEQINPDILATMDLDLTITTEAVIEKAYVALGLIAGAEAYYDHDNRKPVVLTEAEKTTIEQLKNDLIRFADNFNHKDDFAQAVESKSEFTRNNYFLYLALLQCAYQDSGRSDFYWRSVMERITKRVPEAYREEPFYSKIVDDPELSALLPQADGTMPLMSDKVLEAMGRLSARMFHLGKEHENHAEGILFPLAAYFLEHLAENDITPVFITATLVPFAQGFIDQLYTYLDKPKPVVIGTGCEFDAVTGRIQQMEPMDKMHKLDALEAIREILPDAVIEYAGGDKMLLRKSHKDNKIILSERSERVPTVLRAKKGQEKHRFSRQEIEEEYGHETANPIEALRFKVRSLKREGYAVQVPSDVFAAYSGAKYVIDAFQNLDVERFDGRDVIIWEQVVGRLMLQKLQTELNLREANDSMGRIIQTLQGLGMQVEASAVIPPERDSALVRQLSSDEYRVNPYALEAKLLNDIAGGQAALAVS
jgi:hydroxymethylpyrimidine pyrophosphatase-like HAD family hydrolase